MGGMKAYQVWYRRGKTHTKYLNNATISVKQGLSKQKHCLCKKIFLGRNYLIFEDLIKDVYQLRAV